MDFYVVMADEQNEEDTWDVKFRIDEETEFLTELAFHETERWIEVCVSVSDEPPTDDYGSGG